MCLISYYTTHTSSCDSVVFSTNLCLISDIESVCNLRKYQSLDTNVRIYSWINNIARCFSQNHVNARDLANSLEMATKALSAVFLRRLLGLSPCGRYATGKQWKVKIQVKVCK